MATSFPTSLDAAGGTLRTDISSTDDLDASGKEHDVMHVNVHGAAIALETKVGTGASTPVADAVFMGTGTGTSGWDTSPTFKGDVTVGVDGTGHDFKLFGDTASAFMLWDTSADDLILAGAASLAAAGDISVRTGDTYPVVIGSGKSDTNNANMAIGTGAGAAWTGGNNVAIGLNAMNDATSADTNTAVGNYALDGLTTADYCTAIGYGALSAVCGASNTAVGRDAGANVTSANNTAIGMQSMDIGAGGGHNTTLGYHSGRNWTTGSVSVAAGAFAGGSYTEGDHAVVIGYTAGYLSTTARWNVAVGSGALYTNVSSGAQTAVGFQSLYYSTATTNSGFGAYAGHWITTGANNTMIGYYAGDGWPTTGANNTCLGNAAKPSAADVSNEVTLGNTSISALRCQVDITVLSDGRDKDEVEDLNVGLGFIRRLKPRRWSWNMRDGGKVGIKDTGFVAQELQQAQADEGAVIPNLVYESNPERLESSKASLIPVLVKAIQELDDKVEALT